MALMCGCDSWICFMSPGCSPNYFNAFGHLRYTMAKHTKELNVDWGHRSYGDSEESFFHKRSRLDTHRGILSPRGKRSLPAPRFPVNPDSHPCSLPRTRCSTFWGTKTSLTTGSLNVRSRGRAEGDAVTSTKTLRG